MKKALLLLSALLCVMATNADTFNYRFNATPLSEALDKIAEDHPEVYINFIYNELGNYTTSAGINTDNAYEALRQTVGLNPVSVMQRGNRYFVEALQHGRFRYVGRATGTDKEPVEAATVLLLSPKDSTVLTYGITDVAGRFNIPCDRTEVIAKLSCVGYKTTFRNSDSFNLGTIVMEPAYVQLNRLVVEAQNATAYSDKTVYRPSAQQKRMAHNATDLLTALSIPQIKVGIADNSVTDNAGMSVRMFINGAEASPEELQGLPTSDVRTVEYIEFPTDPRYKGAERVINFIVVEYLYGGYTKFNVNESALAGTASRANVFSKFTYKRMSYDIYAAGNNYANRHSGNSSATDFLLSDPSGEEYVLTREEETQKSRYRHDNYPLTFRATYNSDRVQIRNTVGFTHSSTPVSHYEGRLRYSDSREDETFSHSNISRNNSLSYGGSFYMAMPHNFSLDITPTFSYSHNNDLLTYAASGCDDIVRHAVENACFYRINAYLRKRIGRTHSFMLGGNGGNILNRLRYLGSYDYNDRFSNAFAAGMVGYNFTTPKLSLYTDAGVCREESDINGKKLECVYPFTHINSQYAFTDRHLISAYFQFAANSPTISDKSSDVVRDNEYLYITGNPYLKTGYHLTLNLSYTWLRSNRLSMNVYAKGHRAYKHIMEVYQPYENGGAIIRTAINNGTYNRGNIGFAGNLKLLGDRLQIYLSGEQKLYRTTGINANSCNWFNIIGQALYYLHDWYFKVRWDSPSKSLSYNTPVITRNPDYFTLAAGWSDGNWNLTITANNLFRKSWVTSTVVTDSRYYRQHRHTYGTVYRQAMQFTCTYTFSYGKKVKRGNEIGSQEGAASAIIK